jgi:arylsulfatase A-like enzyme
MPSQHGVHYALSDNFTLFPKDCNAVQEYRTLPLTLKDRGYNTTLIGKFHLGIPYKPSLGFDYWVIFNVGDTKTFYNNTIIDNGQTYQLCCNKHIVDFWTQKAVDYINKYNCSNSNGSTKPFFMMLTYDGPYLNPPSNEGPVYKNRFYKYYANMIPRERINENYVGQLNGSIPTYFSPNTLKQGGMERYWDNLFMLNDHASLANMAAQNAIVDDGVGKVMDALKRKGMMNNTLVILSTDQGNYIGQHGLIGHGFQSFPLDWMNK